MQKRKKRSNRDFMLILAVVVLSCIYIIGKQELEIYRVKQEEAATRQRIETLNDRREKLEEERKLLDNPRYIEKLARDNYNMVGKNEVPLFIVDGDKEQQAGKTQK